jgi:hypothetical protein
MNQLFKVSVVLSLTLGFLILASCATHATNIEQDLAAEQKWTEAFNNFVLSLPQCPKVRHPLVEGQMAFGRFSGSCFECRKPLGVTETKINRFTQERTTDVAVVYTCSEGCSYNVCSSCAR